VTSCTFKLSKRLLSYTQRLERKIATVVPSSLKIISTFSCPFNALCTNPKLLLATCDVESLFTKIPLDNLLALLNHHLPSVCSSPKESSTILSSLAILSSEEVDFTLKKSDWLWGHVCLAALQTFISDY
jgi:hypothetical protein